MFENDATFTPPDKESYEQWENQNANEDLNDLIDTLQYQLVQAEQRIELYKQFIEIEKLQGDWAEFLDNWDDITLEHC